MTRLRKRILLTLALNAVAVAAWFLWGSYQSSLYEARLSEMRAGGRVSTLVDLRGPHHLDGRNGWRLLAEADALRQGVDRRWTERHLEGEEEDFAPYWSDDEPWTDAQREAAVRYLEELAPSFHKLNEALRQPFIWLRGDTPYDDVAFGTVSRVYQMWDLAARAHPERSAAVLDRMLQLLSKWRVRNPSDIGMRALLVHLMPLRLLRDRLEEGYVPGAELMVRWNAVLEKEETTLVELLPLSEHGSAAMALWIMEGWRKGEDPMAPMRERFEGLAEILPRLKDDSGTVDKLNSVVTGITSFAEPPWYATTWYGRPWVHKRANDLLDVLDAEPRKPWKLERVRRVVALGDASQSGRDAKQILHAIASLRLARIALREAADTNWPIIDAGLLDDPISGKPFVIERGTVLEVHCPLSDALLAIDEGYATVEKQYEDTLFWRVP